jgi:hypothetical protein
MPATAATLRANLFTFPFPLLSTVAEDRRFRKFIILTMMLLI